MILAVFTGHTQTTRLSLNSNNPQIVWQVKPQADVPQSGQALSTPGYPMPGYVKGIVPGAVFTAYVEAKKVPDPNYADNIWKVDESFYNRPFWYRTEFELPASYREGQHVWLHFDNTNRYADFYFNGNKLSGTPTSTKDVSGHMLRTKYDITSLVRTTSKNAVAVLITDADQKKTRNSKEGFGVTASPTYLAAASWDWMPYVPGRLAGITGNAYVEIKGAVTMEDPWVRSQLESNEVAYLSISSTLKNAAATTREAILSGVIQPGNIRFSKKVTLGAGASMKVELERKDFAQFVLHNPALWWPNGYGQPNLYTCKLTCSVGNFVTDEREISFGIRQYEYQFVKNAAGWPVMNFFINGQRIFLKGGNWGMSEYLLRCHGAEYETKIRLHKDMNYNMIRTWTGCVTDDEFYDYCDQYGIMVWDDFWLYVAYNDVANDDDFKRNALDKVKRLRNHPSIALWCGANETHPKPALDNYLRAIVAEEDHNDRMYKSSSNQDGLSGSGWWGNQPPKHHFETSGSNLAWNKPPYPYGADRGYGMRSEIGTATFPTFESVKLFIPEAQQWPLPTDDQLKNEDDNVWNKHYFGKEASNASPVNYKSAVNTQFGESKGLEDFCEKAQFLNIEVMKGMYEAWNDKMWNDASGMLIWMSQSAYPSFVWQTYDYYYDATGAYWGAKKACEPVHIQWNASNNSIKVINATSQALKGATAIATVYDLHGKALSGYGRKATVKVPASNQSEAFTLNFNPHNLATGKKVFASSSTTTGQAAWSVDGAGGSRWESDYSDAQWIYVDLGKPEKIQSVVIKWENAYAQAYALQVSDDAQKWRTVYSTATGKGNTETVDLKPQTARYVRMNGLRRATRFGYSLYEMEVYGDKKTDSDLTPLHFIKLELKDADGRLLGDNFYWRNGVKDLDYTPLNSLPAANVTVEVTGKEVVDGKGRLAVMLKNHSGTVAFGNRLRLVNKATGERVLPVIMSDNYLTLMPGEEKIVALEAAAELLTGGVELLLKQYGQAEKSRVTLKW
ncbi:discoidin domain-containing protein [Paraflavitalea sp. CAU 1676]|uniref:galactose-binding domain-containing protein n=1 Tax=Paraflavitalea sp. CAU 1676 TaxID=3032598 RepID=UPI0023DC222F|nr:discoidin domain-containing protein [Paraflavitalea sp. CAU 1676]MDF2188481.1 discoidin domain-containing protein [Paraflavitalea sp. CAU 1676]